MPPSQYASKTVGASAIDAWSERGTSMKIEIPYGDAIDTVELADRNVEQVIIPNSVQTGR